MSAKCCVSITGSSSFVVESQTKLFLRSTRGGSFAIHHTVPHAFTLDVRVQLKHRIQRRLEWLRIPEINAVAVFVATKAQFETGRVPLRKRLGSMNALTYAPRNRLRSSPEGGRQSTFPGQGSDHCVLSDVGQKPQRAVHAGLSTPVCTSDHC